MMKKHDWMIIYLLITLLVMLLLVACNAPQTGEPAGAPTPGPTPTIDRLAAPPVPEQPTQADLGAHVYYQVCMACHGDKGQGLTDEWREVWKEDANCWQPDCHGADHPRQGFEIPKTCCPAVIGDDSLASFDNALELFTYNADTMPWWNPGYLKREEFWQVTAYLMRARAVIPNDVILDEGNAFAFQLRPVNPLPGDRRPDVWFLSGILALVAGLLVVQRRYFNK